MMMASKAASAVAPLRHAVLSVANPHKFIPRLGLSRAAGGSCGHNPLLKGYMISSIPRIRIQAVAGQRWMSGAASGPVFKAPAAREVPVPAGSLIEGVFKPPFDHIDCFEVALQFEGGEVGESDALAKVEACLDALLEAFVDHQPAFITQVQQFRNILVTPLGLRTSPLGCPVSSLVSEPKEGQPTRCNGRFVALDQQCGSSVVGKSAFSEVLLGANDKHLNFRSVVRVDYVGADNDGGGMTQNTLLLKLATIVTTHNGFGSFYMNTIEPVHRTRIAPAMLESAVSWSYPTAERLFAGN